MVFALAPQNHFALLKLQVGRRTPSASAIYIYYLFIDLTCDI